MRQPEHLNTDAIDQTLPDETNFSLVAGGPLFQLYLRTRLARPALELVLRRTVAMSLLCWLPLLLLALIEGHGFGGVSLPFARDIGVHIRFLAALPILIGAEYWAHQRFAPMVREFVQRGIITPAVRPRFDALVASTARLRNSVLVEVVLMLFAILISDLVLKQTLTLGASTWYASGVAGTLHITKAGYWYEFVSSSILRFIILRWYYRLGLWYHFLWRVRGLPLHLNLFHPDRAAGLGFLAGSVFAFAPVLAAQSMILAGVVADRIWHAGATLPSFKMEIVVAVIFLTLITFVPLFFFTVRLENSKRKAKREYGVLASEYVEDFHRKWIQERGAVGEPLLGTSDLQSLADLGNAYSVVSEMRLVPFTKDTVIRLAIVVILPLLPLTLTMVPLEQIVDQLIKLMI